MSRNAVKASLANESAAVLRSDQMAGPTQATVQTALVQQHVDNLCVKLQVVSEKRRRYDMGLCDEVDYPMANQWCSWSNQRSQHQLFFSGCTNHIQGQVECRATTG